MREVFKNVGIGLVIVLVFFGIFGLVATYKAEIIRAIRWVPYTYQNWAYERERAKIREAIASDTAGGQTPEETFDMFLAALKAGDIKKAASYYVYERKEEAERGLTQKLTERGSLQQTIDYFTKVRIKGVKKCDIVTMGCSFVYDSIEPKDRESILQPSGVKLLIKAGALRHEVVDISKPEGSHVWKIEQ